MTFARSHPNTRLLLKMYTILGKRSGESSAGAREACACEILGGLTGEVYSKADQVLQARPDSACWRLRVEESTEQSKAGWLQELTSRGLTCFC